VEVSIQGQLFVAYSGLNLRFHQIKLLYFALSPIIQGFRLRNPPRMASTSFSALNRINPNGLTNVDDDLNREIIKMLQVDGRRSYKDIAKALKVSEGTIRNRIQSMKEIGALRIVAVADPTAISYKADAMIGLKVAPGHTIEEVSERLGRSDDVVYILWVSGRYDLLIEIVTNERKDFLEFLETEIHSQPDIASSETMTGLKNFKNQFLLKYS
jgi:Lrp/AsnC family transcriptional regulator for asnA, asnC and gidA